MLGSLLTTGVAFAYQSNGITISEIVSTLFTLAAFSFSMSVGLNVANFGYRVTVPSALIALMFGVVAYLPMHNLAIAVWFGGMQCMIFSMAFSKK